MTTALKIEDYGSVPPETPRVTLSLGEAGFVHGDGEATEVTPDLPRSTTRLTAIDSESDCRWALQAFSDFPEIGPDVFQVVTPGIIMSADDNTGIRATRVDIYTTFRPNKDLTMFAMGAKTRAWMIPDAPEWKAHFKELLERNTAAGISPSDFGAAGKATLPKALLISDESLSMLPNGKADRDFQNGILLLPKCWGKNEEKATRYFNGKEGHVVEYQPSEVEKTLGDAPERALTALDERFNKIKSEAVADVIDILFHHWNTTKDPQTNAATINAARLCQYRNITLSGDNLKLHWHALRDAFSFALRETSSDLKAQVFFSESQGESTEGPGAKYIYSPGFMLQYALRGQPLYFAPFLQKVWALDPVRENEAKRLARYLRADWRMNTQAYLTAESGGARAARWHNWAFLLSEAGIDVESIKKKANRNRLIETIARAVETLYQMEVIAEGGFDIYHPNDRKAAENLPPRGALDAWLGLRVCLAPSAALREALLETDGKRRAGRARDAKALASERAKKQLRGQREAKPKRPSS